MSKVKDIIAEIVNNDPTKLTSLLNVFDLSKIKYIKRMTIFEQFLQTCALYNSGTNILDPILIAYSGNIEDLDIDNLIGDLCGLAFISVKSIAHIIKMYEDISPEEILESNILNSTGSKIYNFPMVASRLEQSLKIYYSNDQELNGKFKEMVNLSTWIKLHDMAAEIGRKDVTTHIKILLEKILPPKEKPEYIKNKIDYVLKSDFDAYDSNESKDKVFNIIKNISPDTNFCDDNIKSKVDGILDTLSENERSQIIGFCENGGKSEPNPDMLEGPENNIYEKIDYGDKYHLKPIKCLGQPDFRKSDGCRMLTCTCISDTPDEEEFDVPIFSWFTGNCEVCKISITKPNYCMRLPLDKGGWIGCFCSSNCAISCANEEIQRYKMAETNKYETYTRFNEIDATVQVTGIADVDIYDFDINNVEQKQEEEKKEEKKKEVPIPLHYEAKPIKLVRHEIPGIKRKKKIKPLKR